MPAAPKAPLLHFIAGPNGAGKTTLYRLRIAPRFPNAEFINADQLALEHFGHPAATLEESALGQQLAEERRLALMQARRDLVTESTFSHPSKLELVREAQRLGYLVLLYHVNVRSPDLSVLRVEARVREGGHPVPESKIRERFKRNQELIREAAAIADFAYVFDNSSLNDGPWLILQLQQGHVVSRVARLPAWAKELYTGPLEAKKKDQPKE